MASDKVQLGSDGKRRLKSDGTLVLADTGSTCCCANCCTKRIQISTSSISTPCFQCHTYGFGGTNLAYLHPDVSPNATLELTQRCSTCGWREDIGTGDMDGDTVYSDSGCTTPAFTSPGFPPTVPSFSGYRYVFQQVSGQYRFRIMWRNLGAVINTYKVFDSGLFDWACVNPITVSSVLTTQVCDAVGAGDVPDDCMDHWTNSTIGTGGTVTISIIP